MTRILFGPWNKVSLYLDSTYDGYATEASQILPLQRPCELVLTEGWETIVDPHWMVCFLFLRQAAVSYTSDQALHLLPVQYEEFT